MFRLIRRFFGGSTEAPAEPLRCACGCGEVIAPSVAWVQFCPDGCDPSRPWVWVFNHLMARRGSSAAAQA